MSDTSPALLLPTDRIVTARFPSVNLALTYADATHAARGLETSHLSGPAASRALAEGLVAAALLSAETDDPDEAVSFQLNVHGPVGTVFAEATGAGHLRGYTKAKIIDALDARAHDLSDADLYGPSGAVQVIRSVPGKILSTGGAAVPSASVSHALAAYHSSSLQRRSAFLVSATIGADFTVAAARGLSVERMPDGNVPAFVAVLEALASPKAAELLDGSLPLAAVCAALRLPPDGVFTDLRPLEFRCRCSPERVAATLAALPEADRAALAAEGKPAHVHCHLCGRDYSVDVPPPAQAPDSASQRSSSNGDNRLHPPST